jgi:hypothetical protein
MPRFDFVWYDDNMCHLAEHGATPEEFEEVERVDTHARRRA